MVNKTSRLEKKKATILKKIEAQKKKGEDTNVSEKNLAKVDAEILDENAGGSFEFESFIPVARMQTESEFEGKSSRQKSLSEALSAAASKDKDESGDGGNSSTINFGMQGMVKQLRNEGVMATRVKKKAADKSIQDVLKSENDLVDVLRDSFNTDVAQGLESRAQVAAVICSWRETQTKQKRQAEVEAEMDTREWTKPIPTGDYINLRTSFMRVYGKIEDRATPSKEYLEKKLQELENGEFRAENMSEVVSKDEVDPDVMVPIFDSKGSLSVKRGSTTVPLPSGPEQLRRRLSVMLHATLMLAIKHTNREEIQDVNRDLFERYKDYLLGDYVWGLSSTDLQGHQVQTPPWSLVLSYEQAIRKRAYNLMVTEHVKLGAALEQAWKCPTTKERHFITPLALYSKRSYPNTNWGEWNPKGKGKSNKGQSSKGKTKGKGASVTPDGSKICFRFNQGKSYVYPRGFHRMQWSERKRANWGNILADFTYKAFPVQVVVVGGIALFENPEDLGAIKSGEHMGVRPASMWQWQQFDELLQLPHVKTVAFYQQDFGTDYLKPTRLLLGHFPASHTAFCAGVPLFDDQGFYAGPLEGRTAVKQLM
eukprot:s1212_g4.t1